MDDTQKTKPKKHDEWPNTVRTRDELDSALEAGLNSGRSDKTVEEIFAEVIAKHTNG